MKFAQRFVQHSSGDLGVPIIKGREKGEQDAAHDHVMKVRDDEVGTAKLPIERCGRQHDAREAGDQKLEQKSATEEHRGLKDELSDPHRAERIENLNSLRS